MSDFNNKQYEWADVKIMLFGKEIKTNPIVFKIDTKIHKRIRQVPQKRIIFSRLKKLLCLLLISGSVHSQCPVYVHSTAIKAKQLVDTVSLIINTPLTQRPYEDSYYHGDYFSSDKSTWVRINFKDSADVHNIVINTSADNAKKILDTYLIPAVKPCAFKSSQTWIFWNKQKLIFVPERDHGDTKMMSITIEEY